MKHSVSNYIILLVAVAVIVPYSKVGLNLSLLNFFVAVAPFFIITSWPKNALFFDVNFLAIIALLFFAMFIDLLSADYDLLQNILWPLGILILFQQLFSTQKNLINFAKFYVYVICFCSVIAVFQKLGCNWAWEARMFFGVPDDLAVLSQLTDRNKAVGLAYYSVQFSYQLLLGFCFVLCVFNRDSVNTGIYLILILLGVITTGSMSNLLIMLMILAYVYFKYIKKHFLLVMLATICMLYQSTIGDRLINLDHDSGFTSRLSLLQIAIDMVADMPLFGWSPSEIDSQKSYLAAYNDASDWIENTPFHNSHLTSLLENGWLMFFDYALMFVLLLKLSVRLEANRFIGWGYFYPAGLTIGLLLYIVKSSVHNAGIQTGDIYGWLLFSFVLSSFRLQNQSKSYLESNVK